MFLAIQLFGLAIILWDGLPIYRHLFVFEKVLTPLDQSVMWGAVILIQISYWCSARHAPRFQLPQNAFVAHIILFSSRLSFVFASSLFALVAYRNLDVDLRPERVALFVAVLFSVFCVSRSLEVIGNQLLRGSRKAGDKSLSAH